MTQQSNPAVDQLVDWAEPFDRFGKWLAEAEAGEPNDPNAMALATATADGAPSVRMVLLKGWDVSGFVFYTHLDSRKGAELGANDQAALLFHWKSLRRQIRIEGRVEPVGEAEADAYFATRPRASQIGAWASKQSQPMAGRFEFEAAIAKYTARFGVGTVPRPPGWSGFRLVPQAFEFWRSRRFRLHEREVFRRAADGWRTLMLYP